MGVPWRESASLILAAGKPLKVLLLQRGSQGSFANSRAFPGGVVHPDDFSPRWRVLLGHGHSVSQALIPDQGKRAPCLVAANTTDIPREIGFRITALRETFEETGILLAQPRPLLDSLAGQLALWREEVLKDGCKFFEMFQTHKIYPDVGALKLWSDWLTPLGMPGKRFDTVFFVAEGDQATRLQLAADEMDSFEWISPGNALMAKLSGTTRMAPPQMYEFSRLLPFESAETLLEFADQRQKYGCALMFPVRVRCVDGVVGLMPGDDAYPDNPDLTGSDPPLEFGKTVEQLRTGVKNLHRMEWDFKGSVKAFQFNITLQPEHCDPLVINPEALAKGYHV